MIKLNTFVNGEWFCNLHKRLVTKRLLRKNNCKCFAHGKYCQHLRRLVEP